MYQATIGSFLQLLSETCYILAYPHISASMDLLRHALFVTLRRSAPSLDVHISNLQRRVCYPCRERILRQLALEYSRYHLRRLGTASRSIYVIPVSAFEHSDGGLKLICLICHPFSYSILMIYFWTDQHSDVCCS